MKRNSKKASASVSGRAMESDSYDQFVGRFVDTLQSSDTAFAKLREEWVKTCPSSWKDRFEVEVTEIDSLLAEGMLCRGDAA